MPDGQFNRAAAKAAGYTDAEIDAYLSRQQPPASERPVAQVPMGAPTESTRAPRGMTPAQQSQAAEQRAVRRERFQRELGMIPATIANVSRDIPGAEAAQAFARSLARGQTYREALGDIRGATGALPTAVSLPTRIAGGALAGAAVPATVAMRLPVVGRVAANVGGTVARQAATYGALQGALEASPDVGMGERALRSGVGAAAGGALTKALQTGGTMARAKLGQTRPAREIAAEAQRDAIANPLYSAFRAQPATVPTQRLAVIMDLPVVRSALRAVRSENNILRNLPDTDPRVLDAVYKRVGDKAFTSKFGFDTDQSRRELMGAIDDAFSGPGQVQYSPATRAFAEGTENMEASLRGARSLQRATSPSTGATLEASLEDSPEALLRWAQTATPRQREMAVGGVLGEVKQRGFGDSVLGFREGISLFPGVRRAMTASEIIEQLERGTTSPQRRVGRMTLPTFLNPSENDIPRNR